MLDKLEKKIGRYAIKNLIFYVLGGYVIGYILFLTDSSLHLYNYITLEPTLVMQGQVWRLFTWVLTIPQGLSIFIIFMFLLYYFIGRSLEQYLGAFKYNIYIFSGWFFMTLGAMIVYWVTSAVNGADGAISMNVSTYYINLASFLAFAVIYPDVKVYFFGILPVKIKYLAWIDVGYLALKIISGIISLFALPGEAMQSVLIQLGITPGFARLQIITEIFSILVSLLNFLIFFLSTRNMKRFTPKEIHRRAEYKRSVRRGMEENKAGATGPYVADGVILHRCAVCGRTSSSNPELTFRYCSKCSGNHEYCQDHIFTHQHVQ